MNVDLGFLLYLENAVLTAGAVLAWIHRDGHTIWEFKGEPADALLPVVILVLTTLFWPIAWLFGAIGLVAALIEKLSKKVA